jgi:UDP-N-acetylmuramate dehydrogenase
LSAAWLIEQCGWKGHRNGDGGVSAQHALVLVNHGAASGAQLLDLARRIAESVRERFGVALEPEPRIVGAAW